MHTHSHPVVPAVIPESFDRVRDVLREVSPFTREVQIDIVDDHFVPFTSWPYRGGGSVMLLREFGAAYDLEIDLMIEEPERALPLYVAAGARRVVIHLEAVRDHASLREHRRSHTYALGLSINNDTPLSTLTEFLPNADYVQLMGIAHIGSQGQPFDERVLERVRTLRSAYPDLLISIDGSVNQETLPRLRDAGANRFVAGSAILGATDPAEAFRALVALATADGHINRE